ncbi:glycoside hydrolase family 18 protein [Streptosporangium soli]|nr:hypothetical protein [Streptosporangium sp. KLBMP 9127]
MSERPPGTLPGPVTALAAIALAAATGTAIWLLPAEAGDDRRAPATAAAAAGLPLSAATELSGIDRRLVPSMTSRPRGFVGFVDTARTPGFDLSADSRRTGVRFYTLGHLTAGPDGCTPRWHGMLAQGRDPVANRLAGLRTAGGDAGLSFGGAGRDPADACTDQDRLTAAYRRVVGAFDPSHLDFEVTGDSDHAAALRRAGAVIALKDHAPELEVGFSLPLSPTGLADHHVRMLRETAEAGAVVDTVNLLAPLRPVPDGGHRHALASAARVARDQIAIALGIPPARAWRRVALTTVLAASTDLSQADAEELTAFAARNELAWLSTRGARPTADVLKILSEPRV